MCLKKLALLFLIFLTLSYTVQAVTLKSVPNKNEVLVGDEFHVDINIENVEHLWGLQFNISFDVTIRFLSYILWIMTKLFKTFSKSMLFDLYVKFDDVRIL